MWTQVCVSALLLGLFANAERTWAPGQHEFTMHRPEGIRTYYVWVPVNYSKSSTPVPVVFAYHGLGEHAVGFFNMTGLRTVSEANNFLVVYAQGTTGALGPAWNAGTCCHHDPLVNDYEFSELMVGNISANFNVDRDRTYCSGFSNGAMMCEVLACKNAPLFRAYVSVSGIVELEPGLASGEQKCSEAYAALNHPVPLLFIHGNADPVVPWTGDPIFGYPSVPENWADWAKRNACTGKTVQTYNKGSFSNEVYQACRSNTTLQLMKHQAGGHVWPMEKDFNTAQYLWSWYQQL